MVFAGIYPVDTDDYEELRHSMEKLQLNDSSLVFEPESSAALGFGFRCGFLGMLHMEIIQERLEREFNMTVITTVPNVSYYCYTKKEPEVRLTVNNPSELPDPSIIETIEEPFIKAQVITKSDYVGQIMNLCVEKRGELQNQVYLTQDRVEITFNMPMAEIVFDFYDRLKSVSKGYASFDYHPMGYQKSDLIEEPIIKAQVITKSDYVGQIMNLCVEKRGELQNQVYLTQDRVEITFNMPMAEIVFDFYDRLKSVSKGYASFDYHPIGYQKSDLVKLDVLLNHEQVDALSALVHRSNAFSLGKKICIKLKELIPRQQFEIPVQASIGAKVIARETIKALRKDVTAKCYGGDISRKRKLLEKQKEGKKRMRQVGRVEVPQEAFLAVLKLND